MLGLTNLPCPSKKKKRDDPRGDGFRNLWEKKGLVVHRVLCWFFHGARVLSSFTDIKNNEISEAQRRDPSVRRCWTWGWNRHSVHQARIKMQERLLSRVLWKVLQPSGREGCVQGDSLLEGDDPTSESENCRSPYTRHFLYSGENLYSVISSPFLQARITLDAWDIRYLIVSTSERNSKQQNYSKAIKRAACEVSRFNKM